jgi:hypothetical protein
MQMRVVRGGAARPSARLPPRIASLRIPIHACARSLARTRAHAQARARVWGGKGCLLRTVGPVGAEPGAWLNGGPRWRGGRADGLGGPRLAERTARAALAGWGPGAARPAEGHRRHGGERGVVVPRVSATRDSRVTVPGAPGTRTRETGPREGGRARAARCAARERRGTDCATARRGQRTGEGRRPAAEPADLGDPVRAEAPPAAPRAAPRATPHLRAQGAARGSRVTGPVTPGRARKAGRAAGRCGPRGAEAARWTWAVGAGQRGRAGRRTG